MKKILFLLVLFNQINLFAMKDKKIEDIVNEIISVDDYDNVKKKSYEYYDKQISKIRMAYQTDKIKFEEKKYCEKLNKICREFYLILDSNQNNDSDFYFLVWRVINFGIKYYGLKNIYLSYYWSKIPEVSYYSCDCNMSEFSIFAVMLIEMLKNKLDSNFTISINSLNQQNEIKFRIKTNLLLIKYILSEKVKQMDPSSSRRLFRTNSNGVSNDSNKYV
ncbi:hypothetical protein KJ644_03030 [Candidatus Dependentiae bacterium]|nr:hypothetical protein [Candidatus Dependentiae bacterium]MBU4387421.1 hypothetical protein [Candidatus Dependentiae bacterium]MCG2756760.1 hypothetical protein [Candidatus Dependentiae bacterium]